MALVLAAGRGGAAEPIRVAMIAELTGANAETSANQVNGARLAVDEINAAGGVLGRPLLLEIEDNQSTHPGSVAALARIVGRGQASALITPVRSTQILAMMPALQAAGLPAVTGGTDYTLTHADNPWIFRVRPHDGYSARVLADFGVNMLKRRKWAVVYTSEAFGIGGRTRLVKALLGHGVTPALVQGINPNVGLQDLGSLAQAIRQSEADVIATYIAGGHNAAVFARELRRQGIGLPWVGSPSIGAAVALQAAGAALHDSYSVSDFSAAASAEAARFAQRYRERYGAQADFYAAWPYDGLHLIAQAIRRAGGTRPDDIRKALLATRGFRGAEGTYDFDSRGDGLHGYSVVRNERGRLVFIKHITFSAR